MNNENASGKLRPVEELRRLLDDSEKLAVNIKGAGADRTTELLHWLDKIEALFIQLGQEGTPLESERGRWEAVQGAVQRYEKGIRRELAAAGGLDKIRSELPTEPAQDHWWWWLDVRHQERRIQSIRKTAISAATIILLLLAAYWLFSTLFPVDPIVQETYRLQIDAERALENGDIDTAIKRYEESVALAPSDVDSRASLVVLYKLAGRNNDSQAVLERLLGDNSADTVYTALAQAYLVTGNSEDTLDAVEQALDHNPENVGVLMLAASAFELQGDITNAIATLQEASDIADRLEQAELQAIARIRLGQLLQSAPLVPNPIALPE